MQDLTERRRRGAGSRPNLNQRHVAAMNIYDKLRVKPLLLESLVVIEFVRP